MKSPAPGHTIEHVEQLVAERRVPRWWLPLYRELVAGLHQDLAGAPPAARSAVDMRTCRKCGRNNFDGISQRVVHERYCRRKSE